MPHLNLLSFFFLGLLFFSIWFVSSLVMVFDF